MSHLHRLFSWLLTIHIDDPIRQALNRGLAVILLVWFLPTVGGLLSFLAVQADTSKILFRVVALLVLLLAWHLNRRGTAAGAMCAALGGVITLPSALDPASYTAPWGQPILVPVLYAVPIALAALFVTPWAGLWTALLQLLVIIGSMLLLGLPTEWILNFALFGTLNFAIVSAILVGGATIFTRKLHQAATTTAALQQLTAELDQQVAERTADLHEQKAALEAANQQLRTYALQAEDLAVEQERVRLARDIHDGLGHHLNNVKIHTDVVEHAFARDAAMARDSLTIARAEIKAAQQELQRAINALVAEDHLIGTLEELLQDSIRDCQLAGMHLDLVVRGTPRPLAAPLKQNLYRIGQEALHNIRQHAQASRASVELDYQAEHIRLCIADDGVGMAEVVRRRGHGLDNLYVRAALLGGNVRIEPRPSEGVRISVEVPHVLDHDPARR